MRIRVGRYSPTPRVCHTPANGKEFAGFFMAMTSMHPSSTDATPSRVVREVALSLLHDIVPRPISSAKIPLSPQKRKPTETRQLEVLYATSQSLASKYSGTKHSCKVVRKLGLCLSPSTGSGILFRYGIDILLEFLSAVIVIESFAKVLFTVGDDALDVAEG